MVRFDVRDEMHHPHTLKLAESVLAIIDMQEAFRSKIADFAEVAERIVALVNAAKLLDLKVIVTEQYPRGLGHTAVEIGYALPTTVAVIHKTTFSSCGADQFESQLARAGTKQVLVCGTEAHICVNQTVHDLLVRGYQVHLLTDCISARDPKNKEIGLAKMQLSGAIPSSVETALFELMGDSKHEQFRAVQNLIKKTDPRFQNSGSG